MTRCKWERRYKMKFLQLMEIKPDVVFIDGVDIVNDYNIKTEAPDIHP